MALRHQFPDQQSEYASPYLGVNLRESYKDLRPGQSPLMQNCVYIGGTRSRTGSVAINGSSFGANQIRGGTKFYRQAGTSQRLIAYGAKISGVSDNGMETVLTSGMTSDKDTFFTPWSITDSCYVANNTDTLGYVDNAGAFHTLSGTNIPSPLMVCPLRDRLLGITTNGIERTNARVDTTWSSNSSWATFRPSISGKFTAIAPYSYEVMGTTSSGIVTAVLAMQANAFYVVTGTNFGTDVTASTASTGEDSSITLRDPRVGTSSPYSITNVPGVGTFWFTSDLNVYFLPSNQPEGRFVGDNLVSNLNNILGVNNTNLNALSQVWMTYFDRKLILSIPTGNDNYPTRQFWMDMYSFIQYPQRGPVWYGPMLGQSICRAWPEIQSGDNQLVGGEGNSATGAFVYKMLQPNVYTDAVGSTNTAFSTVYQTYYKTFGRADLDKYIKAISLDMNAFSGTTTVDVYDLSDKVIGSITVTANSTSRACQAMIKVSYGDGQTYGSGITYADYESAYAGWTAWVDRSCGQYISVRITHSGSLLRVDAVRPTLNLRKREQ